MARRSGTRKSTRQNATFSFPSVARRMPVRPLRLQKVRVELRPVEDRRRYHPLGYYRPARSLTGHPVKPLVVGKAVVARPARRPAARPVRLNVPGPSPVVRFEAPKRTIICVRRKRRREVLMALGRGNGRARKRRNWFSEVSCR